MYYLDAKKRGFELFYRTAMSVLALIAIFLVFSPVGEARALSDGVIRLHVIANSDSDCDQALKLKVRDGVLETCEGLFADCKSVSDAICVYGCCRGKIMNSIRKTLTDEGEPDLKFDVTLSREHYETREYDGFALPDGEYISLRILLGKAEGKNWWCVLFPPLCSGSSATVGEKLESVGVEDGAAKLVTGGRYRMKFRIAEFFGSVCDFLSDRG